MSTFFNPLALFKVRKVIVFGSYHPNNKPTLDYLVNYLKERGFQNTKLAIDIINVHNSKKTAELEAYILSEIEKLMQEVDYNIFVFFPSENNSTLIELTSLIKSPAFEMKREKTLVCLERNYNVSMLTGLIQKGKIYTFFYDNIIELCQRAFIFLKQNIYTL